MQTWAVAMASRWAMRGTTGMPLARQEALTRYMTRAKNESAAHMRRRIWTMPSRFEANLKGSAR